MTTRTAAADNAAEQVLDEAVARISELSARLWAVRRAHRPVTSRGLRGVRVRCAGCGRPSPCPTLRAAGPLA